MAWTPTTFRARWPEFTATPDALVQPALDEAARSVDPRLFAAQTDDAVGWLAADLIARSPGGENARLVAKDGTTTYGDRFRVIARGRAGGGWFAGQRITT